MTLRPLRSSDYAGVNALHRSVWWPERSQAGWRWLETNPARLEIDAPVGWVVEDSCGEPAAFVGNMIQRFWQDDHRHHGATGFSIIVPPEVRGQSRLLLNAFIRQPHVFARYTFNANSRSAPLYARYGLIPWPPTTHALKLSWIVDPAACFRGRVLREIVRHAPGLLDRSWERLMNPRLEHPARPVLPPGVAVLSDLTDRSRYADFWTALKAEGRLTSDRAPETLRWRLSDPDLTLKPLLLAFNRGRSITGYAMAMVSKGNPIEPPFLEILDLVALRDEPHAIPILMQTLLNNARSMGAAKVRIQTVSEEMLRRLGPHAGTARREGGWGHCHVRFSEDGPDPQTWAPTPFDGDYAVCLRPIPMLARSAPSRSQASKSADPFHA